MKSESNEVSDRVILNVHNKVETISYQVWSQASSHLLDQVKYNVYSQVWSQIWIQVTNQVNNNVCNRITENILYEISK